MDTFDLETLRGQIEGLVNIAYGTSILCQFEREAATRASQRKEVFDAMMDMVGVMAILLAVRDPATGQHSRKVANLVLRLALAMRLPIPQAQMCARAGRLHDVGKVVIPAALLHKRGSLTAHEWELMRVHPAVGADIVSHIALLRPLAPMIRAHHERWDGQGYPDGLKGEAIPLGARILMVADAYLAMTVDRPYQRARVPVAALRELCCFAGSQFDPQVVKALEQILC